mgnify:CR=1 FL=1
MAHPTTRAQFKDYCLRKLGHPVIQINVDDDQVDDRIDEALSFWYDYHYDGTEKIFMKHMITQADIDRRWIYCPDAVNFVTGVIPFDQSNSSINMFDLRYQLRLHDLYDFTSVSYVSVWGRNRQVRPPMLRNSSFGSRETTRRPWLRRKYAISPSRRRNRPPRADFAAAV